MTRFGVIHERAACGRHGVFNAEHRNDGMSVG